MTRALRSRAVVAAGGVLLAIGAWLLVQGYLFVDAWVGYVSSLGATRPGTPTCLCPQQLIEFHLAPSPSVAILSYALLAPVVLLLAVWIHRRARTMAPTTSASHRLDIASFLLVAGMGSALLYLAVGAALDALRWYAAGPLRYPFLGLLLGVPLVVLLAGIFDLLGSELNGSMVQYRDALG